MYHVIASGITWAPIYFILIVCIGGFFVINLFLAVIFEELVGADEENPLQYRDTSKGPLTTPPASATPKNSFRVPLGSFATNA